MNEAAAPAGALDMFTTVALRGVLEELEPEFRASTGRGFTMAFGPGGIALAHVRAGNINDVVVSAPPVLETLTSEGFLVPGSIVEVTRSIVGVAVRAGAPKPAIGTVAEFRAALLAAESVAYTNPATGAASGVHMAKVLEQLGIKDQVNARAKLGGGGPVAEFLARGEATLAVQQICEHMLVPGVDVVGPVPDEVQTVTTLAIALHARAPAPDAGRALIELLRSPRGQSVLPKHGLQPIA